MVGKMTQCACGLCDNILPGHLGLERSCCRKEKRGEGGWGRVCISLKRRFGSLWWGFQMMSLWFGIVG